MGLLFKAINPIRGVRDYSCGFRAYSGRLLSQAYQRQGERLFSREGFACMVAILLRLDEEKAVFGEVPIDLRYDKKVGASKMKVLSTVSKTLGVLGRERLARLRRRSLEVCP
jgi:dolichol-phosphate mannosyltransferase